MDQQAAIARSNRAIAERTEQVTHDSQHGTLRITLGKRLDSKRWQVTADSKKGRRVGLTRTFTSKDQAREYANYLWSHD